MRRAFLGLILAIFVISAIAATNADRISKNSRVGLTLDWNIFPPPPLNAIVERPTRGPIAREVAAQGVVETEREVQVMAPGGRIVAALLVQEGQSVEKGEILLRFEDGPVRKRHETATERLNAATSTLESINSALPEAEANWKRIQELAIKAGKPASDPSTPPARLLSLRAQFQAKQAEQLALTQEVETLSAELERLELKAPLSGVIEEIRISEGEETLNGPSGIQLPSGNATSLNLHPSVAPGGGFPTMTGPPTAGVLTILDPSRLRIRAMVDEADVPLIQPNQKAQVFLAADPRNPLIARIKRVATRGNPAGDVVTFPTILEVEDPNRLLRAGMRVNLQIEVLREEDVLGIPVQAVTYKKLKELPDSPAVRAWQDRPRRIDVGYGPSSDFARVVYRVRDDRAQIVPIETGTSDEKRVEVRWGLEEDDLVVVGPFRALDEIQEGQRLATEDRSTTSSRPLRERVASRQGK